MNAPALDCLCAGIIVADHVCEPIDALPRAGELVLTAGTTLTLGGCAANVAVDLARCGRSVNIAGVVGNDPLSDFSADFLRNAGVGIDLLRRVPSHPTSSTLIVNVRGDDRRFIHCSGANDAFDPSAIPRTELARAKVLYLGGYCITDTWPQAAVIELLRAAQELGIATVLDVVIPRSGNYWPRIAPLLRFTDLFLPNDDEARAITGIADPLEQARRFRSAGAKEVIITCGERGLVAVGEETLRAGRFEIDFVDGTGSGDAFAAGAIIGLLEQRSLRERLALGSALGASCVRAAGATTGVFRRNELDDFLQRHSLPIESLD